jgi:glycosyltransferase involved in cell wall biosynthesis
MSPASLVSIVVPAFNSAVVIEQTLQSIQAQTFKNFEVIVVDDGSTDNTVAVTRRICESDPRFVLVTQPHGGVSAARNTAIARARGKFIAFLDADDVWFPEKLARQMELFRTEPRMNFAYSNFYFWDGVHDKGIYYKASHSMPDGDAAAELVFANVYAGICTVVVRRELLAGDLCFDETLTTGCEDWDLWLRMAECGLGARGIREPLARYRRWAGNMSNRRLKMAEGDVRVLEKNLRTTRRPELRPLYKRSLAIARSKLELVRARQFIETQPDAMPAAVRRTWRLHPRQFKWLMRFVLLTWPKPLGGRVTERIVHRKLIQEL